MTFTAGDLVFLKNAEYPYKYAILERGKKVADGLFKVEKIYRSGVYRHVIRSLVDRTHINSVSEKEIELTFRVTEAELEKYTWE